MEPVSGQRGIYDDDWPEEEAKPVPERNLGAPTNRMGTADHPICCTTLLEFLKLDIGGTKGLVFGDVPDTNKPCTQFDPGDDCTGVVRQGDRFEIVSVLVEGLGPENRFDTCIDCRRAVARALT